LFSLLSREEVCEVFYFFVVAAKPMKELP
jgi:hypothetical protein